MLLHPCSELETSDLFNKPSVDTLVDDEKCLEYLAKLYSVTEVMGSGKYGVVIHVVAKDDGTGQAGKIGYAIKIMDKINENRNEIIISCQIDECSGPHFGFVKTFGWLLCGPPPKEWRDVISTHRAFVVQPNLFGYKAQFYTISELGENSLNNVIIDHPLKLISIVFEVLYALWYARSKCGFVHNDLYKRNIILFGNKDVRHYSIGEETYKSMAKQPKIADFGLSKLGKQPRGARDYKDDVNTFLQDVCENGLESHPYIVQEYIEQVLCPFSEQIMKLATPLEQVLTMPIFDVLKGTLESDAKRAKTLNCQVCNQPAYLRHLNSGMNFCREACFGRMGVIGDLL